MLQTDETTYRTYVGVVKIGRGETWENAVCTEFPLCYAMPSMIDMHSIEAMESKGVANL
jgi:hypothetical protein